jgi:hypothetical protein
VNLKQFLVDALSSALDLSVGTPDDVLRHVTPDVLAQHLPRPLWARLLTACLGAPKVDATLVVETIGVPNLCEHMPANVIWACIADIAARSLGKAAPAEEVVQLTRPKSLTRPPLTPPPPEAVPVQPVAASASQPVRGPAIPKPTGELADLLSELEEDEKPVPPARPRPQTSQRFRQSNTGIGRPLGTAGARRPQAQVPMPARAPFRRGGTEVSEPEAANTAVDGADWQNREPIAVDDSQLVDWQSEQDDGNKR